MESKNWWIELAEQLLTQPREAVPGGEAELVDATCHILVEGFAGQEAIMTSEVICYLVLEKYNQS